MMGELWEIYRTFFKIGAVTFGGGYSMLPMLKHELAVKRDWLKEEDLLDFFAISQSLPGIIAVNMATLCGNHHKKTAGAAAAVLGVITPSILVISIIAALISNFAEIVWVQKALRGINVAVAVLLLNAVISMGKKSLVDLFCVALAILSFVLVFFFKVSPTWLIVLSVLMGIALKYRREKK